MGVKGYFKKEFQWSMFGLQEENATDFYLSCFQTNHSAVPLLITRLIVFLGCQGILLASIIMTVETIPLGYWFVFLTHWGLIFITATAGLGFVVSANAYFKGPIDASFGLPWYVKAYWVTYNMTMPIAFFITLFYWILLTGLEQEFAINKVLDIFIHGINSVLMVVLLVTSGHSSRLLHFHHAMLAAIVYLIFSIVYYYAGGVSPSGESYIYPMLDWSRPGLASITAAGSAIFIIIMHCFVVAVCAIRTQLTKNRELVPITDRS